MQEALAASEPADQQLFAVTTCYAASSCQWDLGCPFLNDCHYSPVDPRDYALDIREQLTDSCYD
jgi:hypothetical protein